MNADTPGIVPQRPSVLVVDDDRTLCILAGEALGAAGFAVETAADGEAALALLETFLPDIILLDVVLPGVDGITLCSQLRAAPRTSEIPICIMTGLDDLASIQRAFEAGATDFVIKPHSWAILIQHLLYLHRSCLVARELAAVNARLQHEINERERTAAALMESEERLRLALMAADQGLYDLHIQTGETVVSPEYARMLGYEPEELAETNTKFRQRLHDEDRGGVRRAFDEHLSGVRGEFRAEFRQKAKDGGWKWIFSLGKVVEWDEAGQPRRMIGTHTDITERKRREMDVAAARNQLEATLDAIPDLLFELGLDGRYHDYHSPPSDVLAAPPGEFLGKTVMDTLPPAAAAVCMSALQEAWEKGQSHGKQLELHLAQGSRWFELSVSRKATAPGQEPRFIVLSRDITQRKRDEAELRKLTQAVEQSANIIVVTDSEGRIEYVNPRFVQNTGYSLAEVLGQTPRIVKSGEHGPEFYKDLWGTILAGKVWKGVLHNRRKDGTLFWEDTTITPIFDPAGKLINFMAVKEDVTARRLLEQAERDQRALAEALRDTAAALNSTLQPEEVLDRVLDSIGKIAAYDAMFMVMLEGDVARIVRQRGVSLPQTGDAGGQVRYRLAELPLLGPILATREPCLVADTLEMPTCASGCRMIPGTRSCVGIPLEIRGSVVGAIILASATPGHFTAGSAQRLRAFAGQASVAIENARLFQTAHHLSVTDGLTGLRNRGYFFDVAKIEFDRIRRYGRALSVVMIDIDHFKNLNDTHGHMVGDAVLYEVARQIQEAVRTIDTVARYGGEEFVVLMPETDLAEALRVAERVRRSVAESAVVDAGVRVSATISVGVAEINETCATLEDVLKCADQALYAAKAAGRNRVAAGPGSP